MVEMADVVGAEYSFAKNEHAELRTGLDRIHVVADTVGRFAATDSAAAVRGVREWLAVVLMPHAAWEDSIVYPEVERVTGTEWATKLMRFEHYQIERSAGVLDRDIEILLTGTLNHQQLCDIRGHLLGLEALLRAHIEREERFLLPMLRAD
jgi:iron-sulfur cluster repair protein YtfE (RIC family)